jgi:hypothetical protein
VVNFAAIEMTLMLRVWILWEKSRTIARLLTVVSVISFILAIGLIHVNIKVGNVLVLLLGI